MIYIVGIAMNTITEATSGSKVLKLIISTLSPGLDMLNRHSLKSQFLFTIDAVASVGLKNSTLAIEFTSASF